MAGLGLPGTLPGYVSAVKKWNPNLVPAKYAPAFDPKVTGTPALNASLAGNAVGAGAAAVKPPVRPAAPATDPWASIIALQQSAIQTPAQIAKMANDQALARENATLAAQKAVSDQTIAQYNDQATRSQGFAQALASLQSGEDQQAQARYNDAAGRLTGIGTGLTGAVSEGYQGAVDAAKAEVARLTGGLGQVDAPAAGDLRNAAQYAGVTGPAGSLTMDAANAARMAQSDAAGRAQNLVHIAQGYTGQADTEIAKAASDARALIAKRPDTIAGLVQQLTTNRSAGIQNLASILGQRQTFKQNAAQMAEVHRQNVITNQLTRSKLRSDIAQQTWTNTFETNKETFAEQDATRSAGQRDRQINLTAKALDNTIAQTNANITGVDANGMPTFANQNAQRAFTTNMISAAATLSQQNGYRMNWNPKTGAFETAKDAKGNVVPIGNHKLDPTDKTGQTVIQTYAPTRAGGSSLGPAWGGLTASGLKGLVSSTQKTIAGGLKAKQPGQLYQPDAPTDQQIKGPDGKPTGFIADPNKPGTSAVQYPDALRNAIEGGPDTAAWRAKATRLVNAAYKAGENGRPYPKAQGLRIATTNAQTAKSKAIPYADALATAKEKAAGTISDALLVQAFQKVYFGGRFSAIPGSPHFQATDTSNG